jgi:hypothetical protein
MFTFAFKFLLNREANRVLYTWDLSDSRNRLRCWECVFIEIFTVRTLMISPQFTNTNTGLKVFAEGAKEIKKLESRNWLV